MMKRSITLFFLLFWAALTYTQSIVHTFYMRDGSIFEGEIIEKKGNNYRVRTSTGNELEFEGHRIKEVVVGTVSDENTDDYGAKQAIGISILGPAVFGVHFRYEPTNELFLDAGLHYNWTLLQDRFADEISIESGITISGGLDYFFKRFYKIKKQKVRANGIFLNANHTLGEYDATGVSFGWASEYFKRGRYGRSFLLELGPNIVQKHWVNDPSTFPYNHEEPEFVLSINIRLVWVFHMMGN